ncbi:MAG: hypothetical protein QM723_30195 [Myxococcaceae bacterium]
MLALVALATLAATGEPAEGYEDRLIDWGLGQYGLTREPQPEGKKVDRIEVAAENVFSPSDPWPEFLNIFHWQTKEAVIRRELLLAPGDTWTQAKVEETERNLRRLVILGVAKVVAGKDKDGKLVMLVVAKDRWSLRLNWDYLIVGNVLEYLHVPLTEINFLGRGQTLTIDPLLKLDTFQLGEQFYEPRLLGSKVSLNESAAIVLNRQTGKPEGTSGIVQVLRPLWSLDQEWSFNTFATWDVRRTRVFRGAQIWQLGYPNETSPTSSVPYVYDSRNIEVDALVTRSFGRAWKIDVTGGVGGYTRSYEPPKETPLDPTVKTWFKNNWLPRSEDATYLYGLLTLFKADYRVLRDIDEFALSEDFQIGPRLITGFKWAIPTFAKSNFGEVAGSFRYRVYAYDNLLAVYLGAFARFVPDGPPVNEHFLAQVIDYSPRIEGGRFVVRLLADYRVRDLDNHQVLLGGGSGLSGAAPELLAGRNELLANIEYRTKPFEIQTVYVGFVLFYDAGAAYDVKPAFVHTVGLGLRILLPQLNRDVIRIDLGFVVGDRSATAGLSPDRFNSSFGQVSQIQPDFFDDPI